MPGYKTHLIGGLVSFSSVYFISKIYINFSPQLFFFCLTASLFGSLFPDLDVTSKIQYLFYLLITFFLATALLIHNLIFFIIGSIIAIILGLIKHRTLLHHPLFLITFPSIVFLGANIHYPQKTMFLFLITLSFIAGAFSHIALDFGISKLFKRH